MRSTRRAIRSSSSAGVAVQADGDRRVVRARLGQRGAERAAGQLDDLQRADDPPSVARAARPPRRRGRARPAARAGRPARRRPAPPPAAHGRAASVPGNSSSSSDGAHVQPGAADQQRDDPGSRAAGRSRPAPGRGTRRRRPACADVPQVEQVVRHAAPLGEVGLGGADVHAAVELHGIGVDHLTAEPLGEGDGERGLPGGGGADDGDDGWRRAHAAVQSATR